MHKSVLYSHGHFLTSDAAFATSPSSFRQLVCSPGLYVLDDGRTTTYLPSDQNGGDVRRAAEPLSVQVSAHNPHRDVPAIHSTKTNVTEA